MSAPAVRLAYAQRRPDPRDPEKPWFGFYESHQHFHTSGPDPIVRVRVTEDPAGSYWAWKKADGDLTMIYPARLLVAICFPYGLDVAEASGEGKVVQVRVEEIPEANETKES